MGNNNMKFLLVVVVAAYAKAEADPGFAYSIGHVPLTYAHAPVAYGAPLVYAAPAAGCQNSEGKFVPCAQGSYFGYVPIAAAAPAEEAPAVESERKKREAEADPEAAAEADPEADPWLWIGISLRPSDLHLRSLHLLPCLRSLWSWPLW